MNDELCRKLGYQFNDIKLLEQALTHRSCGDYNNERLEFLGDAVVNFVIGAELFERYPRANEGELSRWRATLVNRETLGKIARQFDLGRYLRLGPGELKSGGSGRLSILSCTMEAVIGGIYLDSDFNTTRACILHWYSSLLQSLTGAESHKDPKSLLQEFLQAKRMMLPIYVVEEIEGEAHQQVFVVSCQIEGVKHKASGKGTSRRRAEQDAAQNMLEMIKR